MDRELYAFRSKYSRVPHLVEVVTTDKVGIFKIFLDGRPHMQGAEMTEALLNARLNFLERMAAQDEWREVQPHEVDNIKEDLLCP